MNLYLIQFNNRLSNKILQRLIEAPSYETAIVAIKLNYPHSINFKDLTIGVIDKC